MLHCLVTDPDKKNQSLGFHMNSDLDTGHRYLKKEKFAEENKHKFFSNNNDIYCF
jgi:hypothetical protein